jgi:hypothetical protein
MITYDENNNPKYTPTTEINQDKAWRDKTSKEFFEKYGAWYYYTGVPIFKSKKRWSEQFRKPGV